MDSGTGSTPTGLAVYTLRRLSRIALHPTFPYPYSVQLWFWHCVSRDTPDYTHPPPCLVYFPLRIDSRWTNSFEHGLWYDGACRFRGRLSPVSCYCRTEHLLPTTHGARRTVSLHV